MIAHSMSRTPAERLVTHHLTDNDMMEVPENLIFVGPARPVKYVQSNCQEDQTPLLEEGHFRFAGFSGYRGRSAANCKVSEDPRKSTPKVILQAA